ncbi:MAG: hypothetical protein AB7S54_05825 [Bacteroidales bacterium]
MIALKKIANPYRLTAITFILYGLNPVQNILAQSVTTIAQEQFNKFNSVEGGWCAADATISLLLPDGKTLWLFGDTFVGEKTGTFSINPYKSTMINNSAIIEDGSTLTAYYGGSFENPLSLIPSEGAGYFWPEHATTENDTLKIFAVRATYKDNGTAGFNFQVGASYIASYQYPDMEHISTSKVESVTDSTFRFGACIVQSGNYTYIFGVKDTTAGGFTYPLPYLARVNQSVDEPWQFYSGSDSWSYSCNDAKPLGDRPMSESFFVYEYNNKFYLIMHEIWTVGELYILEADKITGPWNRATSGGKEVLFAVIRPHTNSFSYNLFAHPQFQDENKILISFNVNTSDFGSIYTDTKNYRARFYWLSIDNAITATTPDTLSLFNDLSDAAIILPESSTSKLLFNQATHELSIQGIASPSVVTVYGIDGKPYLTLNISSDTVVNLGCLPKTMLIVQLKSKAKVDIKKIINI